MHTFVDTTVMRAYHWSTFGSSTGIDVDLSGLDATGVLATSIGKRGHVHLVGLDMDRGCCVSLALDITRKATEFAFEESGGGSSRAKKDNAVTRNCFIDCHADVWKRFPVVPAVRRQTITLSARRRPRSITFVTHHDHDAYIPYFADSVSSFERITRKPAGTELSNINVIALQYEAFVSHMYPCNDVSRFCAGEWLADLLCLIPIQIAVARENRFIPIKDGVFSNNLERSLLGADVPRIIDSLSFGWYESLFQSYMAHKVLHLARHLHLVILYCP